MTCFQADHSKIKLVGGKAKSETSQVEHQESAQMFASVLHALV